MPFFDDKGRVASVAGPSSGICRATATMLAQYVPDETFDLQPQSSTGWTCAVVGPANGGSGFFTDEQHKKPEMNHEPAV